MYLFLYQLKHALMKLRFKPGFVFTVSTTLGLSVGALICVFTLAYVMLFKPLPYPEQDSFAYVEHQLINNEKQIDGRAFTYPNLMYMYQNQQVFDQASLLYIDADIVTSEPKKPMLTMSYVTPNWFTMFAAQMHMGRMFEQTEQIDSFHPVAILSYETWQKVYNSDQGILTRSVSFGGKTYRIIGVLDKNYQELNLSFAGFKSDLIIPWDFNTVPQNERKRWGNDDGSLIFVGALKKDASFLSASHQLTELVNSNWKNQVADHAFFNGWQINIEAKSIQSVINANSKQQLYLLIIGALGLLLIATANIANLFISSIAEHKRDNAIHAAMGASPKQLAKAGFAESFLLMVPSFIISNITMYIGYTIFQHFLNDHFPRVNELYLGWFSSFMCIIVFSILVLFFSLLTRFSINYNSLLSMLQSSGKGTQAQVSKKTRQALITSQAVIASCLIFYNSLLCLDAFNLLTKPFGYQSDNIHSLVLGLPSIEQSNKAQHIDELKTRLNSHPAIQEVSRSLRPSAFMRLAIVEQQSGIRHSEDAKDIDEHYFGLIEQPIIAGENFDMDARNSDAPGIIVNDIFANKISTISQAIGTRLTNGDKIIGVVKSITVPGDKEPHPRFYTYSSPSRNMLLIKFHAGQTLHREHLQSLLAEINTNLQIFSYEPINKYKDQRLLSARTTAYSALSLIIITIFLCGLGLFGIMKYASDLRQSEIGTRLTLGAKGRDIVKLICTENMKPLIAGMTGCLLALLMVKLLFSNALIYYPFTNLVIAILISCVLVLLIGIVASYLPVKRFISQPVMHCFNGRSK